jgi:hypothetical protein
MIDVGQVISGNLTIVIAGVTNPSEVEMSSFFIIRTWFKDVSVTENNQFGRTPFTKTPLATTTPGKVFNYRNKLVEQGSTWVFRFTLDGTYPVGSTVRFIYPEGFTSNKIQCEIEGATDSNMKTRVFPQLNVFDCLNVKKILSGAQSIRVSGVVNPNFSMQMEGLQVHIIQPNNKVVKEIVDIDNEPAISAKDMSVKMTIPNNFRNNSVTYTLEINMDSDLEVGDYLEMNFDGNWTFFVQDSVIIEGVESSFSNKATFI